MMEPDGTHWEHQIPENTMPSLPRLDHASPKKKTIGLLGCMFLPSLIGSGKFKLLIVVVTPLANGRGMNCRDIV